MPTSFQEKIRDSWPHGCGLLLYTDSGFLAKRMWASSRKEIRPSSWNYREVPKGSEIQRPLGLDIDGAGT